MHYHKRDDDPGLSWMLKAIDGILGLAVGFVVVLTKTSIMAVVGFYTFLTSRK